MLHGLLALAAGGQQVLLRTHRAWMPSDGKARPNDAAVSKFQIHSIAFIFFAMPSVLVPSSHFFTPFGVSESMCHVQELPPNYLVGWLLITACSFLGLICLSVFGSCLEQPIFSQLRGEPKDWLLCLQDS